MDIQNLAQVDPLAAAHFDWGSIQWLASEKLMPCAQLTFGYVEIAVGHSNPTHTHPNCDEVLFLIEGELEHRLGDAHVPMRAGHSLHVPLGIVHGARNTGGMTARMVVAFSSGDRRTDFLDANGVAY